MSLIFAPCETAVEVPSGEAVPAEHVGIRGEHLPAHRRTTASSARPRSSIASTRISPGGLWHRASRCAHPTPPSPLAVAHQIAGDDAVVALAFDRDRQERTVGPVGGVAVAELRLTARRADAHDRSRMAMQSTLISSPCNMKRPVTRPAGPCGLPWLNGGSLRVNIGCISAS